LLPIEVEVRVDIFKVDGKIIAYVNRNTPVCLLKALLYSPWSLDIPLKPCDELEFL
jgi:hypothetical protein